MQWMNWREMTWREVATFEDQVEREGEALVPVLTVEAYRTWLREWKRVVKEVRDEVREVKRERRRPHFTSYTWQYEGNRCIAEGHGGEVDGGALHAERERLRRLARALYALRRVGKARVPALLP